MAIEDKNHKEVLKKVESFMSEKLTIPQIAEKLKIEVGKNHWDKGSAKYYCFCINTKKAVLKREQTYSKDEISLLKKIAENSTSKQIMQELNKINPKRKWPGVKYFIHSVLDINRKHMIYRNRYYKFKMPIPSKDFAWFLGVMAGDGSASRYYIRLRTVDKHFAVKFCNISKRLFNLKPKLSYEFPKNASKVYQVHIFSSLLVKYLGRWKKDEGLWMSDFRKKFKWVLKNKIYLASFLEGLFDSEGSVVCNKKYGYITARITISAKPNKTKRFIFNCFKKLNLKADITKNRVYISGIPDCKRFSSLICSCIPRKENRLKQIRKIIFLDSYRKNNFNRNRLSSLGIRTINRKRYLLIEDFKINTERGIICQS